MIIKCKACESNQELLNEQFRIVDDQMDVIASQKAMLDKIKRDVGYWFSSGVIVGMLLLSLLFLIGGVIK